MDAILEAIQHLWGRPWFHEVLIFLFFACIFLFYKIGETEKYLRWRVKRNPQDFQAHLKLGEFLSEFEDSYEEAELEFKKALEIEPKNRDALGELYLVQNKAGKTESAEKTILDLIQLFPDDSTVYVWAGRYYTGKDSAKAEEYFVKAKSYAPDSSFVQQNFGYFLQKQNRIEEAIDAFTTSLKIDPHSVYSLRWIVMLLGKAERFKEAEEYAWKLVSISNNPNDYQTLGLVLYCLDKNHEAETVLSRAIKLDSKNADLQADLAEVLNELGKRDKAEEKFLNAIKIDSTNDDVYRKYGDFLQRENRFDEAIKSYEKALSIDPKDDYIQRQLSKLLIKFEREDEAIELLLEMKNNHPDEYFVYIELASAYKTLGKQKELIESLETSRLLIKQDSKTYWYDLACVESIAGNTDLAFDYLRKSKEENQLNSEWAWEDSDLDWIRDDARFIEIVGEKPQEKLTN